MEKTTHLTVELKTLRHRVAELETLLEKQKQRQKTIQAHEAHFASIVNIANEAIISVDETQQIILFNYGAEKIFGHVADQIIGKPLDQLLPQQLAAKHRLLIAKFAHSKDTARFMSERQEIYGRRKNGEIFSAEASISKFKVNGQSIFTVVLRDITQRKEIEQEREKHIRQLHALNDAARSISSELSIEQVLQKIAKVACTLVNTKYAALGIHDGFEHIAQFIAVGIDPTDRAKIGPLPVGQGLLGLLFHQGKPLIINNIAAHPKAVGFPEHHPPMQRLLGVPIFSKGQLTGALYLTDKLDGSDFTETDRWLVEMLGLQAVIAIENAKLYQQKQRLTILEERERFARDLHDGIIQSIYAVGLTLDQVKLDMPDATETTTRQIDLTLRSLADVTQELRNYIFDLRPQALIDQGLKIRLENLIKELYVNTLLSIQAKIQPDIDSYLSDMQARHVFHICHEALANVARHAKAKHINLDLKREGKMIRMWVKDDGIGFEKEPQIEPGHHGLANMYTRAAEIGGRLKIESTSQQGTCLTLVFRCSVT